MSVLDFVQQAKNYSLDERQEIIASLQEQIFEQRQKTIPQPRKDAVFEIWSPTVDAASMEKLLERARRRKL